jgi:hypothetical protein
MDSTANTRCRRCAALYAPGAVAPSLTFKQLAWHPDGQRLAVANNFVRAAIAFAHAYAQKGALAVLDVVKKEVIVRRHHHWYATLATESFRF